MAIIGTDEEDQNKNTVAQPTTSASGNAHAATDSAQGTPYGGASGGLVGGTGTGSGQGATTGVAATATPTAGGSTPGGYTNLSQYLAVNQGGGATAGQAATNVVQQSADAAKQAQGAYNTSATGDIANATSAVAQNQDTLGKIGAGQANVDQSQMDKINAGAYGYTPNQTALADVGKASQSDLDAIIKGGKDAAAWSYGGPSDFSKVGYGGPSIDQLTVAYGGPNNTSGFTGQTAANQNAAVAADQTVAGNAQNAQGGQSGVSALLKQAYQQPQYTQGENSLDAFLAGGTQGGQQALAQAQGIGQGVNNAYSGINSVLTGAIGRGQQTAADTNKAYQSAINTATANSKATQDKYNAAVQAAKDSGSAAQKLALDAATKAQSEENKRAAAAKAAAEAAAKPPPTVLGDITNTVKKAGGDIATAAKVAGGQVATAAKNVVNPVVSDVKSLPQNVINAPSNLGGQVAGSLQGNQGALNKLATTALSGGANVLMPSTTKAVTSTAKNVANTAGNAVGNAKKAVSSVAKKLGFAHGGEVPSFSKILQRLRK